MKDLVNRRSQDYHEYRLNAINDLDLIASAVLALTWSRCRNKSKQSQCLIQMDCVACVIVDNEIWLASNQWTINYEDICELRRMYQLSCPIWIVTNGTKGVMHAEMQLVSQLQQEGKTLQYSYMGVSKPCCMKCSQVLDKMNIDYASKHNNNVLNWEAPFVNNNQN